MLYDSVAEDVQWYLLFELGSHDESGLAPVILSIWVES
jgi:hypothetical protein